jgi:hypothetical protein
MHSRSAEQGNLSHFIPTSPTLLRQIKQSLLQHMPVPQIASSSMALHTATDKLIYRVIHNSSRDLRPMQYISRMVTPKGSMSTEGESLQVSVLPYSCSICPLLVTYRAANKRSCATLQMLDMSNVSDISST